MVAWDVPADPRWTAWSALVWLVGAGAALLVAAGVRDLREPARRVRLAAGLGASLAGLAGLLAVFAAAAARHPDWDLAIADALLRVRGMPGVEPLAGALAWLGTLGPLVAACFALALRRMAQGRWALAYAALATLGLAGLAIVLGLLFPRWAPMPAAGVPGDGGSFPALGAALGVALAWRWWSDQGLRAPTASATRLDPALPPRVARKTLGRVATVAAMAAALAPLVAGHAWPTDTLAGAALGLAWAGLVEVALALALAGDGRPGLSRSARALRDGLARVGTSLLRAPRPWLAGALAAGIVARALAAWWAPLGVDAYAYAVMGWSWAQTGTFTMPWGDVHTYLDAPTLSHHYPPLYPLLLGLVFNVTGYSVGVVHAVGFATGLAAILVTYLCTRDLYGPTRGLVVAAVVALSPIFVQNTGQAYSENLVLLLFVATMWAILRSLKQPWFIVAAGALAGLGYLTKSSMGSFFVVAGLGGLAWRLWWKGLKVLLDPAYVTAILLFGSMVGAWAWRNWHAFGSWETSQHLTAAYAVALGHPLQWGERVLVTLPFYFALGYLLFLGVLAWLPTLARMPRLQTEHDSGLWLAFGLPLLLTGLIDGALWLAEGEFYIANIRYVGFVAVPVAWLLVRNLPSSSTPGNTPHSLTAGRDVAETARAPRPWSAGQRAALAGTFLLLLVGTVFFALPKAAPLAVIANDLRPLVGDGESVGFVDLNNHAVYRFHPALTHDGARDVQVRITCVTDPLCPAGAPRPDSLDTDWVLMQGSGAGLLPPTYHLVEGTHAVYDPAQPHYVSLWRKEA